MYPVYYRLYPDIKDSYDRLVRYVEAHQGEKGYIDVQPHRRDASGKETSFPRILALLYNFESNVYETVLVHGIRAVDGDVEIIVDSDAAGSVRVTYSEDDFKAADAEWSKIWDDDVVERNFTFFEIVDHINEYLEDDALGLLEKKLSSDPSSANLLEGAVISVLEENDAVVETVARETDDGAFIVRYHWADSPGLVDETPLADISGDELDYLFCLAAKVF